MADQVVEQLKATVDKLENRVHELESRLHGGGAAAQASDGKGMRMILIGPPGAGELQVAYHLTRLGRVRRRFQADKDSLQARARRRRNSRNAMAAAISLPATCCARKWQQRRSWDARQRRSWIRVAWFLTRSW